MKTVTPYKTETKYCQYNTHKKCGLAAYVIRLPLKKGGFTHRYVCTHHMNMYMKIHTENNAYEKKRRGWAEFSKNKNIDFKIGLF